MRKPPRQATDGFTLFETLTALTVLAIGLVALLDAHTSGLRLADEAVQRAKARILAKSLMAEATAGWEAVPITRSGRHEALRWRVDVGPADATAGAASASSAWRLLKVKVSVAWDRNRSLQLETLKLGRSDE